ncbi:MAG: hypothetical protein ACR2HR_14135 [Euzebya sp.]
MIFLRVLVGLVGTVLVIGVVLSALRTVVLPRGEPVRLTGGLFKVVRMVFDLLLRFLDTYESRDRLMSHYAPVTLLLLPHQIEQIWIDWERWFARIAESHTALPALVFFRSPDPRQSWITSAGAALDAAAMIAAVVDLSEMDVGERSVRLDDGQIVRMPRAETCIRAGHLALRRVADQFGLPYDPDPAPDDPISVSREEFDSAWEEMAAGGVPLRADRDQAWRDWAGWRVNYDAVLLGLANLTVAPPAPWISDRTLTTPDDLRHVGR